MLYRVTLPPEMGYEARSHWGVGTFLKNVPREVDLSPDMAESLRTKGYKVDEVRAAGQPAKQKAKLAESETEE